MVLNPCTTVHFSHGDTRLFRVLGRGVVFDVVDGRLEQRKHLILQQHQKAGWHVGIHQVTAGVTLDDHLQLALELRNQGRGLGKIIDHGVACGVANSTTVLHRQQQRARKRHNP